MKYPSFNKKDTLILLLVGIICLNVADSFVSSPKIKDRHCEKNINNDDDHALMTSSRSKGWMASKSQAGYGDLFQMNGNLKVGPLSASNQNDELESKTVQSTENKNDFFRYFFSPKPAPSMDDAKTYGADDYKEQSNENVSHFTRQSSKSFDTSSFLDSRNLNVPPSSSTINDIDAQEIYQQPIQELEIPTPSIDELMNSDCSSDQSITGEESYTNEQEIKEQLEQPIKAPTSTNVDSTRSEDSAPLSELDARVLREILLDESLDFTTEENLKKLLERGTTEKTPTPTPTKAKTPSPKRKISELSDEEFSSTVLKKITDTKLWNAFQAKADAVLESVQIYIENRAERDAKLLASLGFYAWEKIQKDVSRALPSTGRSGAGIANKMRNALFQLSSNSSFVEYIPEDNFLLGPSKYGENAESTSLYDQLNTPLDEIKSVTESIRDILSGKSNPVASSSSSQRGLKSVAPGGSSKNAERQRRAYERRKKTLLSREKEGVDKKVARAAGTFVDTAWEINREMKAEGNLPGYKTEKIREQARLAASAGTKGLSKLLGDVKTVAGKLNSASNEINKQLLEKSTYEERGNSNPFDTRASQIVELTVEDLLNERSRFVASLQLCLDDPERTWLTSIVDDGEEVSENLDVETLRDVVTTMILTRDEYESDLDDTILNTSILSSIDILERLECMKKSAEVIVSSAAVSAGYSAAERLKNELLGVDFEENGSYSLLTSLEILRENIEAAEVERINMDKTVNEVWAKDEIASEYLDVDQAEEDDVVFVDVSISDVLPNEPTTGENKGANQPQPPTFTSGERIIDTDVFEFNKSIDSTPKSQNLEIDDSIYASVELINEDETSSDQFTNVKTVASADEGNEFEAKKPNFIFMATLRSLDIIFYVVEKTITVGIPGILTAWKTVSKRTSQIQQKGMGSEGWKIIENTQNAKKRY